MRHKPLALVLFITPVLAMAQSPGSDPELTGAAWSPYLVGGLIGALSWLTFYFSDKALGASTAYARVAGIIGKAWAPRHTARLPYYQKESSKPKVEWEVMLVTGVIIGSLVAALTGGEALARAVPPMWQERFGSGVALRWGVAFVGGALMALGARLAGGCTSGHGISGALQLSVGSWVALICFFIGGVMVAMMIY